MIFLLNFIQSIQIADAQNALGLAIVDAQNNIGRGIVDSQNALGQGIVDAQNALGQDIIGELYFQPQMLAHTAGENQLKLNENH